MCRTIAGMTLSSAAGACGVWFDRMMRFVRCRTRLWSRDYGAAINIASNLRYFLLHASWDPDFCRSTDEDVEASAAPRAAAAPAQGPARAPRDSKRPRKC